MPPHNSHRRRAEHLGPERRRPQILDAALDIAATEGVSAVTIASVADRLDVTRPVVYACFANRVDLLAELVQREEGRLRESMTTVLRRRAVDADASVFIDGYRALLQTVAEQPKTWGLVYGSPDAEVAELFGRGRADAVQRCTELLRPTLTAWGMPDAEVEKKLYPLVELWVSTSEGAVRTLLANPEWTPEELAEFLGTSVYHALRTAV
ncbi:TetR/AcrR family transcriptional regulator [Gordonia neofelifaecis]|uniref:Transcriptional regulator, TetR family protein n=1 Tax=Gordonia neofelifaecis NRRL B-59395 TaxID=644548 RepID=F1YNN1_9ACTN|nr:TetR/AcrR family transcriptional regulator [Gordonia neofelifaecis]EGD53641.1 transcriptional regulator, TetR family protein [Gordonia neofelifaecis NRRL B-59395]